ncbi:DNA-binding transcriptional regulator, LysR family [Lentzea albidocapillata subsp. violacea]|uniref:DNA-binding transcriptional regulator, LysR family n=1 Tax=Lentzea albidocapillata subsp. violacea TaxID=128104 RepID=A0A1G8UPB7_9PSEU|nr:LysR family transcriptional regulator [Lentzea albidocapillata]SDJ55726.1 DNA-binding transcriptional regulator, LysR family [Lentzea albidocapillata subsp. violacea]
MELELRHFRIVAAIAEAGSITKAAAALGLAQPALTGQLQRIERIMGGPLFDRDRRGVRPTELGELVLDRARVLLSAVSGLRAEAARLSNSAAVRGEVPGRVRLGSASGPVLGGLIHHLCAAHPDLRVSTHVSWSSEELVGMVDEGQLDFTMVGVCGDAEPPTRPGVRWRTLAVDPVFVLLSDRHPAAGRDEVELAELAGEQWGATPGDGCFGDCFAAACARAGFAPRALYETDLATCIDMVEAGDSVVLCQPMFRPMPGIVATAIAGNPLTWRTMIGWHGDGAAAPFAEEVLKCAGLAYADIIARRPRYAAFLERFPDFGVQI